MIVVHGVATEDGRLAVWGELAGAPHTADRSGRGREAPHPFAVLPPVAGEVRTLALSLPSRRGQPLPSPEAGGPSEPGDARFAAWTVPAVVPPSDVDFEVVLGEQDDVTLGGSASLLADVRAFASQLLARGRFAPGIALTGTGPARARWRAMLAGPDLAQLEDLTRATPGAVLAAAGDQGRSAAEVLRRLIDTFIDAAVRAAAPGPLHTSARATATSAWLAALTGPHDVIDADPAEVQRLRQRLDAWHDSGATFPVRVCLRLSNVANAPPVLTDHRLAGHVPGPDALAAELATVDGDGVPTGWLLEFLLQSVAEPTVLIPAAQVWADQATPLLRYANREPREVLLEGLGRASRIHPDLDDALREGQPGAMALDTAGAYRFLSNAQLLAEAGFGVLLPAWWQRRPELGLSLTVHSRQTTTTVLRDRTVDLRAIAQFRYRLALGGEPISDEELAELAMAKVPLVRLRGRWVYLDADQLRAGLLFLQRGGQGQLTAGEALRLVHHLSDAGPPLPISDVDGQGWLADLLTGRAGERLELLDQPASLRATLRPYQRRGLSWLAFLDRLGVGALLADDMGLGKTIQVLALEAWQREQRDARFLPEPPSALPVERARDVERRPPTLVVCPLSVLGNWQREAQRFTPDLRVTVHHGASRELDVSDTDLVLTTYSVAVKDADALAEIAWDRVVLDEAQHVKNSASLTAQALRRFPARHRVALTGTPVENRLSELWSIMDFLNPGAWGSAGAFRSRYGVPIERYRDEDAAARLRRLTRPYLLRRLKTDDHVIADLPARLERVVWCTMTVEQASLYRAVTQELYDKLKEGRAGPARKGLILAALTKLKQVCNHPAHLLRDGSVLPGRSGKLDRLEEILANAIADGDRALVFTQFTKFGTMLAPYLRARLGVDVGFLHGGTPKGARDELVAQFQSQSGPGVLLLSLKAGGTGLNLTAANHVVHVDRWWNPAAEAQATDRAHRIGQRRDVQVHTFVSLGTIEERVHQMLAEKREVARAAVGSGEGWITNLSTDVLMDLVTLRAGGADE